jgi:hypothetical protein
MKVGVGTSCGADRRCRAGRSRTRGRSRVALNPDKVGTTYPAYTYEVSREKIREYAGALGETDPRYLDDGDGCVAPPTFAAAFTLAQAADAALADPDLGAHTSLVHGSQRYEFGDRPLTPGDVLRCTPRVADISTRGSNEFLTLAVECRFAADDALAVRSETMLVLLGSAPSAADRGDAGGEGSA